MSCLYIRATDQDTEKTIRRIHPKNKNRQKEDAGRQRIAAKRKKGFESKEVALRFNGLRVPTAKSGK
jgi:hypothetical protein